MFKHLRFERSALCCLLALFLYGEAAESRMAVAQNSDMTDSEYDSVQGDSAENFPPSDTKTRDQLTKLGSDFASRIGNSMRQTSLYLSGAGKLELAEQKAGGNIPDGDPLLLHAVIGKDGVNGSQDIYTVIKDHRLMISLGDFATATGLAIKVSAKDQSASGWIGKETQTFALDPKTNQVTVAGRSMAVDPKDIEVNGDDLLVAAPALEKWLGVSFDYEFSELNLIINTSQPFPVEEAYARTQRQSNRHNYDATAKLPPQEPEYGLVSMPYIDTDLSFALDHSPGSAATHNENWSTIASGDYAGFNTHAYLNGTSKEPYVDTARITMGKEDPRGTLLGPLHATAYQFGDVNSISNSLIGGGAQERGVELTNRPLDYNTTKTYTEIRGDSHPGWDVELYRNDAYLDIRHVEADGRYDFGQVGLIVGDNDFRLNFYGPQGERIEEHRHVGVDSTSAGDNKGSYAVSLTQQGLSTWQRQSPNGPGIGAPRLSTNYEYGIKGIGTVNAGLETNNDQGTYRTFAQTGLATNLWDTFYNADVGVDASSGAYSTSLTARRNFGRQSASVQYVESSPTYNLSSATGASTVKDALRTTLTGPLLNQLWFLNKANYSLNNIYTNFYNGSKTMQSAANITTRVKSVLFTAGVSSSDILKDSADIPDDATVVGFPHTIAANFGLRGVYLGGSWRVGAQYDVFPGKRFTGFDGDYSRSITDNVDGIATFTYDPASLVTTGSLGLNWITPKATISPRVQYDTNRNLSANVDVHFGLAADPYNHDYRISSGSLSDSGGIAARIFQDKNGNGVFDEGDKPLAGASLIAIQGDESAVSDENGIAFIQSLGKNRLTDITVDGGSADDPYGISLFRGVAIMPHPGAVTKLDFPIVDSGELDGNADFINDKGVKTSARGLTVSLFAPDGTVENTAQSEGDGYWSISTIKPGIYYLTATPDIASPGMALPRLLEFKPEGTNLFAQPISLAGQQNVRFTFSSENPPPNGPNHARVIRPEDIQSQKYQLEVGTFHSRLALALAWYRLKERTGTWGQKFDLTIPLGSIEHDPTTGAMLLILKSIKTTTMAQAAEDCKIPASMNFECTMHTITTYRDLPPGELKTVPFVPKIAAVVAKPKDVDMPAISSSITTSENTPATTPPANATTTVSPALLADLADYVAINPSVDKSVLKNKTVILNLGSYNSRTLMAVIWFKLKTRYGAMVGNAHLLVQPTQSYASTQTGKYTLRAALPVYDVDDAKKRCKMLTDKGQFCTVEVLPSGLQASR